MLGLKKMVNVGIVCLASTEVSEQDLVALSEKEWRKIMALNRVTCHLLNNLLTWCISTGKQRKLFGFLRQAKEFDEDAVTRSNCVKIFVQAKKEARVAHLCRRVFTQEDVIDDLQSLSVFHWLNVVRVCGVTRRGLKNMIRWVHVQKMNLKEAHRELKGILNVSTFFEPDVDKLLSKSEVSFLVKTGTYKMLTTRCEYRPR
jgi:hypothetical protein